MSRLLRIDGFEPEPLPEGVVTVEDVRTLLSTQPQLSGYNIGTANITEDDEGFSVRFEIGTKG